MNPRILVVEDEGIVREAVGSALERAGFVVETAEDGETGLHAIRSTAPDLVILDLKLPGVDGFTVCRETRRMSAVPIIMLTARADGPDVVRGLELGADDYVTKPFDPVELTARVRAVLRRSEHGLTTTDARDLRIDEPAYRAFKGDRDLSLTAIEMRLLVELVRSAGIALTRDVLLERVWGYDYLGDSRLVDMAVMRLREKLGEPPDGVPYVATVRGVGYRFERG